jgi:hypothetical protein
MTTSDRRSPESDIDLVATTSISLRPVASPSLKSELDDGDPPAEVAPPSPDSSRRVEGWIASAEHRTRLTVLRGKRQQIDELLTMLEAAELKFLESSPARLGATSVDRQLELLRDLRQKLRDESKGLDNELHQLSESDPRVATPPSAAP